MTPARSAELAVGGGAVRGSGVATSGASLLGQMAWAVCDGARSPYNVLVNIFVFAAYFSTVVIPDPVRGQTVWSFVSSAGALLVALGAPVLGAIADAGGRRKPWLVGCLLLGAPCMASLWFATPHMTSGLGWIMAALIGGTLCFEYSTVFASAMLPNVAPPGRLGFLSGLGYSLGNLFGIILFLFYLIAWDRNPHPLFGLDVQGHEPERAVGILAAIWLVLFYLPMFIWTPDSPATSRGIAQAVRDGWANLVHTLSSARRYRNTMIFLIARLLYNEGFVVIMLFTSVVAAGVLHWTPRMLISMGLINSVVATASGVFAGWLDRRAGTKAATILFVFGCLIANVVVCSVTPDTVFFVKLSGAAIQAAPGSGVFPTWPDRVFLITQNLLAFFVTGGLATSRTLMAKLSPPNMLNEFFGLYAVSGNATSFVGPLAIGIVTAIFASQRAGVAVGIVFLLAGLTLMIPVRETGPSSSASGGRG
ncbi:MAG TPA: MFS transporter [Steroidobacteraceae bacterium]|nr:MFS transporter [Steroidobacteraceae bacterium]